MKQKKFKGNARKRYYEKESNSTFDTHHESNIKREKKSHGNKELIEIKARLKHTNRSRLVLKKKVPKYPGKLPVPTETLEKYSKGENFTGKSVTHPKILKKLKTREKNIKFAVDQAARTELLLPEDAGFLEADEGETTTQFRQKQIADNVDVASASKYFELDLKNFGPYRVKYSLNGRHLLLGGRMGHLAAFDWTTKYLHTEINVMETIHDVCWLHIETMFAAAQKDWVYIYDKKGTELHSLKNLFKVLRMEFLPYHFLLATGSEMGYLSWLDISIGTMAAHYRTNMGRISIMKQNPYNATICVGQSKGVVSMWSPSEKTPLARILCHKSPLTGLAIDPRGIYMATSGADKSIKIWDARKLEGPIQNYRMRSAPSQLEFSQNNLLAVGMGNVVEIYRDCCVQQTDRPYLRHTMNAYVENMQFCPYEDVLGVGTDRGFTSLLVPGSGEANFDALERNPYQSKSQRREAEVKALLEKIQPELISLNPLAVAEVDVPSLKENMEARDQLKRLKPRKIQYNTKKNSRKGTAKMARNKKIVQETENKKFYKEIQNIIPTEEKKEVEKKEKSFGVLDRFKKKVKS